MLCFLYYGLLLYAVARGFRLVLVSLSVVSLEQFHSLKLKLIDCCRLVGIYSMKQDVGLAHSFLYIGGVGMSVDAFLSASATYTFGGRGCQ